MKDEVHLSFNPQKHAAELTDFGSKMNLLYILGLKSGLLNAGVEGFLVKIQTSRSPELDKSTQFFDISITEAPEHRNTRGSIFLLP